MAAVIARARVIADRGAGAAEPNARRAAKIVARVAWRARASATPAAAAAANGRERERRAGARARPTRNGGETTRGCVGPRIASSKLRSVADAAVFREEIEAGVGGAMAEGGGRHPALPTPSEEIRCCRFPCAPKSRAHRERRAGNRNLTRIVVPSRRPACARSRPTEVVRMPHRSRLACLLVAASLGGCALPAESESEPSARRGHRSSAATTTRGRRRTGMHDDNNVVGIVTTSAGARLRSVRARSSRRTWCSPRITASRTSCPTAASIAPCRASARPSTQRVPGLDRLADPDDRARLRRRERGPARHHLVRDPRNDVAILDPSSPSSTPLFRASTCRACPTTSSTRSATAARPTPATTPGRGGGATASSSPASSRRARRRIKSRSASGKATRARARATRAVPRSTPWGARWA